MAKALSRSELLTLARLGAEARIAQLEAEIAAIRATLGGGRGKRGRTPAGAAKPGKRRKLSPAGRARIAAAARARWAKWRKEKSKE